MGVSPDWKKTAIEEDNVASALLWSWFNSVRKNKQSREVA
ncbi:hypothetical protein LEP1GSC111_4220 [Leptospira interrogans str. UT126]|nr:hypothetical protein LEP1GSC111_4220 [Leptospira interrogans str. UT126]